MSAPVPCPPGSGARARRPGALVPLSPGAVVALARRPQLWPVAWAQWKALLGAAWWAGHPRLPVPAPGYMAFRLETMYGTSSARLPAEDLVGYLEWCRSLRSFVR
jgi:hypothetical protein